MSETWIAFITAIITLALQTLGLIIAGVKKLSAIEEDIRSQISSIKFDNYNQMTEAVRNIGETFTAMRQKITEVELYVRDNYVAKDTLHQIILGLGSDIRELGGRIEKRMERIEEKLDESNGKS